MDVNVVHIGMILDDVERLYRGSKWGVSLHKRDDRVYGISRNDEQRR
jgi:hypothetical protein